MKSRLILSLLLFSSFILTSCTPETGNDQSSNPFDAAFGPDFLQNLFSWKITLPAIIGGGGEFSGIFVLGVWIFLHVIFLGSMRRFVPVFQDNNKLAGWAAFALSGIVLFSTNFLNYMLGLVNFITVWGFMILFIVSLYFLYAFGRRSWATGSNYLSGVSEKNAEADKRKAEAEKSKAESDRMKTEAKHERKMLGKERGLFNRFRKLGKASRKGYDKAGDLIKEIVEMLERIPDASFVNTPKGKERLNNILNKMAALSETMRKQDSVDVQARELIEKTRAIETKLVASEKRLGAEAAQLRATINSMSDKEEKAKAEREVTRLIQEQNQCKNLLRKLVTGIEELTRLEGQVTGYNQQAEALVSQISSSLQTADIPAAMEGLTKLKNLEEGKNTLQYQVEDVAGQERTITNQFSRLLEAEQKQEQNIEHIAEKAKQQAERDEKGRFKSRGKK